MIHYAVPILIFLAGCAGGDTSVDLPDASTRSEATIAISSPAGGTAMSTGPTAPGSASQSATTGASAPNAPPCSSARFENNMQAQLEWTAVSTRTWDGDPTETVRAWIVPGAAPAAVATAVGAVEVAPTESKGLFSFTFRDPDAAIQGLKLLLCHQAVIGAAMTVALRPSPR